jgi:hypothetical protein
MGYFFHVAKIQASNLRVRIEFFKSDDLQFYLWSEMNQPNERNFPKRDALISSLGLLDLSTCLGKYKSAFQKFSLSKNQKRLLKFLKPKAPIFCKSVDNVLAKKRILSDETATNF